IAVAAAAEGMKLVLADIDADKLNATVEELAGTGAEVIGLRTDVSSESSVQALADTAFGRFGNVHLLINNAGVALAKSAWETTQKDWEWVMGVNLYGVTNGLRAFIPRMLEKGEEGHIVNTASIAGLLSEPALAAYNVSKFGVVTLSEGLHHDLTLRKAKINVSVLCPGWVKTRIAEAERHREADQRTDFTKIDKVSVMTGMSIMKAVQNGIEPQQVASDVINAVKSNKFYILTHPHTKAGIQIRMEDILQERAPTLLPI
ncbi:MAG TPA: SDR family NAD(P)-dependent oxidoreductase, partial [Accumulibacter sp.]|nr:SDR family NAD(P)-dependent oxidoreductase [Accumulibacter sp.]